jgi:anaerobic sulfite reductase subunit C
VERIVKWVYRRAWSGRLLAEQLDDLNFEAFRTELTRDLQKEPLQPQQ